MRSVWIISAIAAIAFVTPVFAQQVDEGTRKQLEEQLGAPYRNAYDKQDAAAIAKFFAKDGVLVLSIGKYVYNGPQEIEQIFQSIFKAGFNHTESKIDQSAPLASDMIMEIGEY